ncbi:MAG TPA: hypothetical protein VH988_15915 [Thermoanaerobaculia bacterium]|nr:hypothetical protein [Thermoanaerobaculia bacterium]
MRWLQRLWNAIHEVYCFFKPVRFVVIPLALLLFALIESAQGQDAIRFLVETDPSCPRYGRMAVFLLMTSVLALQAWYWSRQLLRIDLVAGTAAQHPAGEKWMPRLLGASVFLIAIGALARAAYLGWSGSFDSTMRVILGLVVALVLLLAAFLVFVTVRRRMLGASPRVATRQGLSPVTIAILCVTALVGALLVLWTALSPLTFGSIFQSPSLLMLAAALWVGIGSFLAYLFDSYHVPLAFTFLALAVAFSGFNDNHDVRTLDGALPARQPLDKTFDAWYARLAAKYPNESPHPVFVVATEGGGIRAAYWTAAVLTAIQDQAPEFSDHLFAISSVSGGSLGSTVFTALVADSARTGVVNECSGAVEPTTSYRRAAQQMLSYDFLAPTLGSMLHADFVQRFLPVGFIPDRAKALETGWETGWSTRLRTASGPDGFFSGGLLKMYADRPDALLPSLFLNGTSVKAGNRIIASNCDVRVQIPAAVDLFEALGHDMRLSTAAHNSARFAYVSPAGTMHTSGGMLDDHVVDGGYFENSGAATAADIIALLQPRQQSSPFAIHLLLIKFQEVVKTGCTSKPVAGPAPQRFLNEALSPLRALVATRGARGELAYAEALRLPQVIPHQFLLTQETKGIMLPLGWLLAQRTRNAIDLQVGPKVPPGLDCALVPLVQQNVDQLQAIARLVSPAARAVAAPELDPVQKAAAESERQAKQ